MAAPLVWYRKKRWWALIAAAIALVVIAVVAFQPLVTWELRRRFAAIPGYQVTFDASHLRPIKGTLELTRLKAVKPQAGGDKSPFFYAETMEIGLRWHELIHGNIVANIDVDRAKVHLIAAKAKEQRQLEEVPDLARKLEGVLPMRVDRVQAKRSELTFIDRTAPETPRVWLHELEGTAENIATRAALSRGQPTTVAVASRIQQNGELSAYLTADPLAKGLWFAGEARATNLDVRQFYDLIASKSGVALDQGTLDVFTSFECKQNHLTGGVKPILKNPHVVAAKPGVTNWFKAALADTALQIFQGNVEGQRAVGTTIPIEGHVLSPQAQLWPTVLGVLRNSFVEGVTESYDRLPPPQAPKKESLLKQAADALNKKKAAPKAQPPEKQP